MKIIILGAGQVGSALASHLVSEKNEITVVDNEPVRLQNLAERYDLRTVQGEASHPSVLRRAGAQDADMIVAVTSSDESNMIACQVAYTLFHTPTKIARIRSSQYMRDPALFSQEALPIDVPISPEELVTQYVRNLIVHPGALQVVDFAKGKARMISLRCNSHDVTAGGTVNDLHKHFSGLRFWVTALFREGTSVEVKSHTPIQAGDEIFLVGSVDHIETLARRMLYRERAASSIVIAGGGNIGRRLAGSLENDHQVKIIEVNAEQAKQATEELNDAIILHGSAIDRELLIEENIDNTDIFCALTNKDETNILSSLLAKRLGARKVLALVNQDAFTQLVRSDDIDLFISPHQATVGPLLAYIRRGDVTVVHSLRGGKAEAVESIIHGDKFSSHLVGRAMDEIKLPPEASIAAIVRDGEVIMPHRDIVFHPFDHVIVFIADKGSVPEVEKLFRVDVAYA